MFWQLKWRAHEWLADHVDWVQYPRVRYIPRSGPSLATRYRNMTRKQKGWVFFFVFWGLVVSLSIYGNLID